MIIVNLTGHRPMNYDCFIIKRQIVIKHVYIYIGIHILCIQLIYIFMSSHFWIVFFCKLFDDNISC